MATYDYSDQATLSNFSSAVTRKRLYKDIELGLTKHPSTDDILALTDIEAVKNAVKNLVLTSFYERPFHPFLGTRIRESLFELMDRFTALDIEDDVRRVLDNYEPRISLISVRVYPHEDENAIEININFRVKNLYENTNITVLLKRTK